MSKMRLIAVTLFSLALSACGGVDQIVERQCPEIDVLATADSWRSGDVTAQLTSAQLTCFIDRDTDDLLADIKLQGTISESGVDVPFFIASLNKEDGVINRVQYQVKVGQTAFVYELPRYKYGARSALADKPRLVAGFVLTPAQLAANRTAYRKRLGMQ